MNSGFYILRNISIHKTRNNLEIEIYRQNFKKVYFINIIIKFKNMTYIRKCAEK